MTDGQIDAYVDAVADFSVEAVVRTVNEFNGGLIDRNNAYAPTAAELSARCRLIDDGIRFANRQLQKAMGTLEEPEIRPYKIGEKPPAGFTALGPIKFNPGMGADIDMSKMTAAQKEDVMRRGGLPAPDPGKPVAKLKRF